MYFTMDEIGAENTNKINTIGSESSRWKFIYDIAKEYGFEGIHFTPSLYNKFKLDLNAIPDYFQEFKLTFHYGGITGIISVSDYEVFDRNFENVFEIALKNKMHDISIHPPYIYKMTTAEKGLSLDFFSKTIDKWLKILMNSGISLSLETHVAGEWFLFDGLHEYVNFIDRHPGLGVLIDISHNYYKPQYSEDDIVDILGNTNVKGLHISDALRGVEFKEGTHLAIGDGSIDFHRLMNGFRKFPELYGVLEIKSTNEGIERSLNNLQSMKLGG